MSPDLKKNKQELREIEMDLLLRYEHISEAFGFQGLKAKLISVLFISAGTPRSLTELAELTHFSKAQVSRSMRELEMEIPFIIAVKKPQDKEKYYRIEVEFMDMIKGFLVKTIYEESKPTLEGTARAIERLEKLRTNIENESVLQEIDSFLERTYYINKTYKKYLWMVENMITFLNEMEKQWQEEHPNE